MDHTITVSKSRTIAVPVGRSFSAGHAEDFAALYRDWLKGGEPPAPQQIVDALVQRMNALVGDRKIACKQEFVARFGRPEHLRDSQLDDAETLVAKWEADAPPAYTGPPLADYEEPSPAEEQSAPKDNGRVLTRRDIGISATKAFPCDDAPRGDKTKLRDRLRYALTYIDTGGTRWHLEELDTGQMVSLDTRLGDVAAGRITFTHDDDGATFTLGGKTVAVPWSTFDVRQGPASRPTPGEGEPDEAGSQSAGEGAPPAPDGTVDPATWTEKEWRDQLGARRVKVTDAMKQAATIADTIGIEQPATVEDFTTNADLAVSLAAWLESK